jgi:hypothetical protein
VGDLHRDLRRPLENGQQEALAVPQTTDLDPDRLPSQLTGALQALYGHYEKVFAEWRDGGGATPPVFIVVCNNTATSKLVFDWIAGYEKNVSGPNDTEQKVWVPGKLPPFPTWRTAAPASMTPWTTPSTTQCASFGCLR